MNFYKPIPKLRLISIIGLVILLFCNVIIIGKTFRSIKLYETEDPTDEDCIIENYKENLCIKSLETFLSGIKGNSSSESHSNKKFDILIQKHFAVPRYENYDFMTPKIDSAEDINGDIVFSITTDQSANILVTGSIYQEVTGSDVFLSKFSNNGTLLWSEFLSGNQKDYGTDVAVDSQANIIVVGQTTSDDFNKESRIGNDYEVFITKFSPSRSILWSKYLGGTRDEKGICSLDIDSQDNIVIVGRTESFDFPTLHAMDSTFNGGDSDIFIAKFNSSGSLLWSTYLGGTSDEYYIYPLTLYLDYIDTNEIDVVIDDENNVIVTSTTTSGDFPVKDALYSDYSGNEDLFISKFNSSGSLLWSTYLGGEYLEYSHSIAIDSCNDIIVTGITRSNNFPIKRAFQSNHAGGADDLFITKFNSSGALEWSTYLGGSEDDIGQAVTVDNQGNIFITGHTESNDFPRGENHNSTYSGGETWGDAFLSKFSPSGILRWSTYLGGSGDDDGVEFTIDNHNEIILSGNTKSTDFPTLNAYKYSFGGNIDGFLTKFDSSGGKLWSTRAPVVTEPDTDPDLDNLSNLEEYHYGLDPFNPDTDDDRMEDGGEVEVGLNPLKNDAYDDFDEDGLPNIIEFWSNKILNVTNADTDGDLMTDGWEVNMQLDPTLNDSYDDGDSDGLPNIWEFQNNLNANDFEDAADDIDNDGLTNLEEYQFVINHTQALDPRDPDTDNDGLHDGWEVRNRLDPLDPSDASADPDKDYFPNKLEYQLGFNPQSPHELYGAIILIFLIISLIPVFFLRTRKLNREAVKLGYVNKKDKKAALKAGFNSAQERSEAKSNGFLTTRIYNIVKAAGWFNVEEMVADWQNESSTIKLELTDEIIQDAVRLVLESSSPVHLSEIESKLEPLFDKIDNNQRRVAQISSLQQSLIEDYQLSKIPPLLGLTLDELNTHHNELTSLHQYLTECKTNLKGKITKQRELFAPWPQLLTLIQLTADRAPIKLSEIARIVNCSEKQAENLIILLLNENKLIGKYDAKEKVYTKGHDVSDLIQSYIKEVRKVIIDLEK